MTTDNTIVSKFDKKVPKLKPVEDYSQFLKRYSIDFERSEFYYQVGKIEITDGWVLSLSVIKTQISELFSLILDYLLSSCLPFKIIQNSYAASLLLDGNLDHSRLAKIAILYPNSDYQALTVAKWLINITRHLKGPSIPTDIHLGSIVYAKYEQFNQFIRSQSNTANVNSMHGNSHLSIDVSPSVYDINQKIWPFYEIAAPEVKKRSRLLNKSYYPIQILKPDAKGDVIRALYFKKAFQIKSCLVKQGRDNMFSDDFGRDIQDRLKWQYQLHHELYGELPIPKVFDYFKENGSAYLVMEYIDGKPLSSWIFDLYSDRCWTHLPALVRLKLLDCLMNIVEIIHVLHKKGFIHRDVTPANFIIGARGNIHLIDLELAWSANSNFPSPPFGLGTHGFMSVEQLNGETPTQSEDIYGLGALMIVFFTNLLPIKFNRSQSNSLANQLSLFIENQTIANTIVSCFSEEPKGQPSLLMIKESLKTFRDMIVTGVQNGQTPTTCSESSCPLDKKIVQIAINGLSWDGFLSPKGLWMSQAMEEENKFGNDQLGMKIYEGFHTGISGILYLIACARCKGYDVNLCQNAYFSNLTYINERVIENITKIRPGLFFGTAGIGLALSMGLESGLIEKNDDIIIKLKKCFDLNSRSLDIAEGLSGQGLAILHSLPWINKDFSKSKLEGYVNTIIDRQSVDGSWNLLSQKRSRSETLTGFNYGMAGILYFLLEYCKRFDDDRAKASAIKGINWLISHRKGNIWSITNKVRQTNMSSLGLGTPGILLMLLRAAQVFKNEMYGEIVTKALNNVEPYLVANDFTIDKGLAGLGNLYIEAFKVLNTPKWKYRADWLARVMENTIIRDENEIGYWLTETANIPKADLLSGQSGVIYFLIKLQLCEQIQGKSNGFIL